MEPDNLPDCLPDGWTVRVRKTNDSARKVKCYIDPSGERKFYSKVQVARYLETLNSCPTPQKGISSVDKIVEEKNESPDWLPHGWTVESKTRNSGEHTGRKFKIYIETATGCKFYSKPEVSRYLKKLSSGPSPELGIGSANANNIELSIGGETFSKPDMSQNCKTNKSNPKQKSNISEQQNLHGGKHSVTTLGVESVSVRELPEGWIAETKSRKSEDSKQKDMCYTDPVSGYVFRSKVDALRYVETGDISKCRSKPKKRDTSSLISLKNGISQSMHHLAGDRTTSKPDLSQSCKTNKSCITKEKKLHGDEQSADDVVIECVSADEFPAGWIKEIRKRKNTDGKQKDTYYTDPVTGYKFFSKPDALRYLKSGDIKSCKIKPKIRDINNLEFINGDDTSHCRDDSTADITSSNPVVLQNCKTGDNNTPKQEKFYGGKHSEVVVEKFSADELPPGWVKEIRSRKVGNQTQKNPYYKDPVSGYVFRSKPDALRYLQTGDINSCKIKPTKEDIIDLKLKDEDISRREDNIIVGTTSPNPVVYKKYRTDDYIQERKKTYGGKHLVNDIVVERVAADEIPTGWIKEIRTRKVGNRIKKDPYYKDPVSGYVFRSKPDVVRYLQTGDINSCKSKPTKEDIIDLKLKDKDISGPVDNFNVGITSPNPDVSKKCRTDDNYIPEQKKPYGGKHLMTDVCSTVVVERVSADELPAGWIKEVKTRMVGNRIQKDPYYTDPVSGCIFRSKPDVLRYLETGDINSCKTKPKKRDIDDLELNDEDISRSSVAAGKKLKSTVKKLHFGKERSDVGVSGSLVAPEVGNRRMTVSDAIMDISSPTVKAHEAKRTKVTFETVRKDSTGEESIKVSDANDIIASVLNDIFQDEELTENGSVKHSSKRAQRSSKSKNQTMLGVPSRTSKRLAGQKHVMQTVDKINIEAFPTAAVDAGETVADPVVGPTLNTSAHNKVHQQLLAEDGRPEQEDAHHASISRETIFDVEPLNQWKQELQGVLEKEHIEKKHDGREPEKEGEHHAPVSRDMSVEVESLNKTDRELQEAVCEKQQMDDKHDARPELQEAPPGYPYVGSWTADPCLEFAFKTLTGAIPVEENLSFQDYFQAEASQTQKNGGVEQLESLSCSVTQNDVTPQFDAMEIDVPVQQLSANSTRQPPGNFSSPSFSLTNPHDSSMDGENNEPHIRVD